MNFRWRCSNIQEWPFTYELRKRFFRSEWSARTLAQQAKANYGHTCAILCGEHVSFSYARKLGRALGMRDEEITPLWEEQEGYWRGDLGELQRQRDTQRASVDRDP